MAEPPAGELGDAAVGVIAEPLEPGRGRLGIGRVELEQHAGQSRHLRAVARILAQPAEDGPQRDVARRVGHQCVGQGDAHRGTSRVRQLRRRLPVANRVGHRVGQGEQPDVLAADRPELPERGQQPDERAAVAVGDRAAQFVGEVRFLGRERVHRGELVAARHPRAMVARVADGPPALGGLRLRRLAGVREPQLAELAYRLQHPVAHAGGVLPDAEQGLADEALDRPDRVAAKHRLGRVEREPVVEQRQPAHRPPLGVVQQVPRPVDDGEQGLVPVRCAAIAAAQQREPVLETAVDFLERHRPDLGRGELDGERQPVKPGDDAGDEPLGEPDARPCRHGPLPEEPLGVTGLQLAEQVDPLGGDREGRAAGGEHPQVGRRRDEEGDQPGDGLDQVLAVVKHQQRRRLPEQLRDARPHIGPLLRRQDPAAADRVANPERGPHLARDVLRRRHAGQLDHVDDRLGGVTREGLRQPGLAQAAGTDDGHHPRARHQRPQPVQVIVAADQRGRVVAHPAADRPVQRQQAPVRPLERLARIGAEPLAQFLPVALETIERRRGAADGRLAAQQVRQQRFVERPFRVRRLEHRQRVRGRPHPAGGPRHDHAREGGVHRGRPAHLRQRAAIRVAHLGQAFRERQGLPGEPGGGGRVPVELGRGVANESRQPRAVNLTRHYSQPVSGTVADDRVRAAHVPGARHENLEALHPVVRGLVAPDQLDQLAGPHRTAATCRESRQQRLRPIARDRGAPPAHIG